MPMTRGLGRAACGLPSQSPIEARPRVNQACSRRPPNSPAVVGEKGADEVRNPGQSASFAWPSVVVPGLATRLRSPEHGARG